VTGPIRPPLPLGKSPVRLDDGVIEVNEHGQIVGMAVRQCHDNVHVFAERPGSCQCGREYWEWTPEDAA
jgi:hypothetical protein